MAAAGLVAAAASFAALASACGLGAVELEPAELSDDVREICDALLADLPAVVMGRERRDTTPYGAGAAWGEPPVTLRCGTTDAEGLGPASACQVVDGVGWYAEKLERGYRFTTIGRQTYVEVVVPAEAGQASGALVDLARSVGDHVPEVQPCV